MTAADPPPNRSQSSGPLNPRDPAVLARCAELLRDVGAEADQDLAAEMMQTVAKLAVDAPGRGEMLLLLRSLKELRYAFKTFKPYRHQRKVSMFGSARTGPDEPNYKLAEAFARRLSEAGFMVITGAGPGIMEAGNVGAGKSRSFGVAIRLPFEQTTNAAITGDRKLIHFRYFFSRKLVFVKETHAIALFPGGFGTHDEAFEVLTLVQTGRADPLPIVLLEAPGGSYWREWDRFVRTQLLGTGMISPEDLALYYQATDVADAVAHVVRYYRNYHSLRYVREDLVLRIRHAPTAAELGELNEQFKDIVTGGGLTVATAEQAEPPTNLPPMPRLVLAFDRKSLSRLRLLIDRLNSLPSLPRVSDAEAARLASEVGVNESDRGVSEIADEEGLEVG